MISENRKNRNLDKPTYNVNLRTPVKPVRPDQSDPLKATDLNYYFQKLGDCLVVLLLDNKDDSL